MAAPGAKTTVWQAFYDILRAYDMKTMFGNPGSTEQPMLMNFPPDFKYVFGLQEASVIAMADGFSQATRKPVAVSVHGAAGTGNGMGMIFNAYLNKTPLLIISGQQHRNMITNEPFLTNRDETMTPRPYVKWSFQPPNAQSVPAAVIRAIMMALLPPAGPVYLVIPLDDWIAEIDTTPIPRQVSTRFAPDPVVLADFAARLQAAKSPALVFGPEVDRSLGWAAAIQLAEMLNIPVWQSPGSERTPFPPTHPLFRGGLPMAQLQLGQTVEGHDLLFVVGAEIWRYYPYVPGPTLPVGTSLLQITNDPHDAAAAILGDCLLSDARLALEALIQHFIAAGVKIPDSVAIKAVPLGPLSGKEPMTALDAFTTIARLRPEKCILVQETASNAGDLLKVWPSYEQEQYISLAGGGLGFDGPAAVGIALAQKLNKTGKLTVLVIGDGALHYSVQNLYTAVQEQVRLIIVVVRNEQYAVLKEFAEIEKTPGVPALDLPGLDASAIARSYGCPAQRVKGVPELENAWKQALEAQGPVLIEVDVNKELMPLVAHVSSHPR